MTEKLDYLQLLGVDCIWLMPLYPSPLRDDGYDIADFCNVDPPYGSMNDLRELISGAHQRNIRIIMDLVLNHTSDEHPWFKSARSDRNSPYRDYYVWSDTDQKYRDTRIIFLDTESSNWTWDDNTSQYYWHRFYSSQPDLNYDNPHVQEEMLKVAEFWLDLGIDGFRADAVPYLFEREGTNCENLSETHVFLKKLRSFIDEKYSGRILLCEANQWPEDVRPYFGEGDEFHMAFHFPVMPRIFMALKKGNYQDIVEILKRTPAIPENCQWCVFLRNHDELTLEMVTAEERTWMWKEYAPDPQMKINLGIRRRLAPLLDNDHRKIELANSLLFTLPGSPIIYYGDEIGMGDNIHLPDRNGLRTPMQWDSSTNAGFSNAAVLNIWPSNPFDPLHVNAEKQIANPSSLFHAVQRMIQIRKQHKAFGHGSMKWIETENPALYMLTRQNNDEHLLFVHNLSDSVQTFSFDPSTQYLELFSGQIVTIQNISLEPLSYHWYKKV